MQSTDRHPDIRPARAQDAEQLFTMAGLLATSASPERQAFERTFAAILDDAHQHLLVVEGSSSLIGYLHGLVHPVFHANGNIGWVEELFVSPTARGTGLGRRLMERFEDWAGQTGQAHYVAVSTRRAHDFYQAIGYAESATYFKKAVSSHSPEAR